jgi:SAM-dependent methyltransferase
MPSPTDPRSTRSRHRPDAPNPVGFPQDDRRIYDYYIAGRQSAALAVAVRAGLFDLLDVSPRPETEIREHLGCAARPLRALLAALIAMDIVRRDGDRYELTPDASSYLVEGKPGWLGGLIDLEVEHFLSPRALLDALQRDESSVYRGQDPWEAHAEDPEKARRFTRAMHSISERPAAGLAEVVDFSGVTNLLDVGGGSGAISLAIARVWPNVRCTVWDLEVVCAVAREYADAAGLAERVIARPGDMFAEPFPLRHDAVLLSQILHDWPPEKGALLLEKAHAALPDGGIVLIHEKLVADDGRGPLANALVNLDMLVWTEGQQYDERTLAAMLANAGFAAAETRRTAGYWSVVTARKGG